MNTREKILDIALGLFNSAGTSEVTTNHIASACGISPGNLYYHFRNKQEIIRELFQRLYARWNRELALPDDHPPELADLVNLVNANYRIIWEYRFAYRELVVLLHNDFTLQTVFREVRQRGYDGFKALFQAFVSAGVMRPAAQARTIEDLMQVCWLISEFWIVYLEIGGQDIDALQVQNGVDLMLGILQPYLTQGEFNVHS